MSLSESWASSGGGVNIDVDLRTGTAQSIQAKLAADEARKRVKRIIAMSGVSQDAYGRWFWWRGHGPNTDGLWPTPVADGDRRTMFAQGGMPLGVAVRWPTPTARDGKGPSSASWRARPKAPSNLSDALAAHGRLNPTWVEWLMGFPLGWTDCGPSGTPSSPRSSSSSAGG